MSFTKIISGIFVTIFIIILYVIIYYALKIMYKDVKNGGKKKRVRRRLDNFGLEVMIGTQDNTLREGSVIPIRGDFTIGRKNENGIIIREPHVSGIHAKICLRNNSVFIEDLNSTNGTFVNNKKITGRVKLADKDKIGIGTAVFKVLA
ncbi:FHA domain-containing protein [Clostridium sp. BJN0001]|uniref:FHA domain-containing protein n=1 Tax=Clostridium sp. BJN0001 TaxID=2930219 RepID=UPI001FD17F26|nr:FHA domain-containing protein [Clostridium sp. BJN0001]